MADPVVGITNGVPTSGTGTITTLGQTLLDGANVTMGAKADAAYTTGSGSLIAILKGIFANVGGALPAGAAVIGKVGIDQTSDGTTNLVAAKLIPFTSGGLLRNRQLIPNNTTAIVVKASAGQLYKIRATNNSATIAYIKLYDAATATAGAGTVVDTIMIPAATAGGAGVVDTTDIGVAHTTGITYVVTTGIADTDTTAPAASAYIVTMYYK